MNLTVLGQVATLNCVYNLILQGIFVSCICHGTLIVLVDVLNTNFSTFGKLWGLVEPLGLQHPKWSLNKVFHLIHVNVNKNEDMIKYLQFYICSAWKSHQRQEEERRDERSAAETEAGCQKIIYVYSQNIL